MSWALLLATLVCACSTDRSRPVSQPPAEGRWHPFRGAAGSKTSPAQRDAIEHLESVGYLSGSRSGPGSSGVLRHDPDRVQPGVNLVVSGHQPVATLMDMEGRVLHRWSRRFNEVWPDLPKSVTDPDRHFWRRVHLYENGDLLAIHEGLGILKLDKSSRVLWATLNRAHHDLEVLPSGDIWVLTRKAHVVPETGFGVPVLEDFATLLDPDGVEKRSISILDCFQASTEVISWRDAYKEFWSRDTGNKSDLLPEDLFHTNSLTVLDGAFSERLPEFTAGNLLVSLGHMDVIAVINPETERVVWALQGRFRQQHDPELTADGHLLVFDNEWQRHRSAVKILDLVSLRVLWQYDEVAEADFYSHTCGSAQQLANENVLVTESDNGRALEITVDQDIVWEFVNPHRAGPENEYIATLFEVLRLAPDFPLGWIPEPSSR